MSVPGLRERIEDNASIPIPSLCASRRFELQDELGSRSVGGAVSQASGKGSSPAAERPWRNGEGRF